MFHQRRLGVKEANAIEDIVVYEMKLERGTATAADKLAYEQAWQVVQRRGARRQQVVQPAATSCAHDYEDDGGVPPVNFMAAPGVPVTFGLPKPAAWACLGFIGWIIFAAIYHVLS